ncbi:MAG TPA: VWA domain-containing protein [Thermoanaerobaculia bacterium]|jgi:VWFA-related protein|nr:VWA domain-containing protein [Thermoanaerobaculia bacterium]
MKPSLRLTLLLTLAACAAAFAAKPPEAPAPPSFGETVEVDVVNVEVYVTDKNGRRITDLQKGDFQLLEDGKPMEIAHFTSLVPPAPDASPAAAPAAPREAAAPVSPPPAAEPTHLLVYVDDQHLKPAHRARVLRQVNDFARANLQAADRISVVTDDFELKVRLEFSTDRAALERVLAEIEKIPASGIEAEVARRSAFESMMNEQETHAKRGGFCGNSVAQFVRDYANSTRADALRTISRLRFVVNSLAGIGGRKAVLLVTDGVPLNPGEELLQAFVGLCGGGAAREGVRLPDELSPSDTLGRNEKSGNVEEVTLDIQSYSLEDDLQRLAAHANAQGVSLFTLQASGLQAGGGAGLAPAERLLELSAVTSTLASNLRDPLVLLASETGGRALLDANDYRADLARMREDLATYYSLGFVPAHHGDGKEHRLEVKVKRPGFQLRYRRSYRDKPALERAADRTLAALLHGFEDNPLNITVEVGEQTPGQTGTVNVPIRLKIPLFKLAILNREASFEGSLRLLVATQGEDGRSSPLRQIPVPLQIPRKEVLSALGQFYVYTLTLQLPPGEQRIAVAVRDELASTTSYLSRKVTVGTTEAAIVQP